MYFRYGIKNSTLQREADDNDHHPDNDNAGNIELKITDHTISSSPSHRYVNNQDRSIYEGQQLDAFGQPVFGCTNFGGSPIQATNRTIAPTITTTTTTTTRTTTNPLFIPQDSLPTWDD